MAESLHTHTHTHLIYKTIVLDGVGPGPPSPHHAPQRQHPPSQAHWPHDTPYATHHNETRPSRNSTPRPAPQVCPPSPPIPPHAHTQAPPPHPHTTSKHPAHNHGRRAPRSATRTTSNARDRSRQPDITTRRRKRRAIPCATQHTSYGTHCTEHAEQRRSTTLRFPPRGMSSALP